MWTDSKSSGGFCADERVPADMSSSGNLTADRRYLWAQAALAEDDFAAAEEILRQILELVPDWPAAWVTLGAALRGRGDTEAARVALLHAQVLDPQDRLGAALHLARLGRPLDAMPEAFVRGLFDQYAPRFETHLVEALGYCGPQRLRAALEQACVALGRPEVFAEVLDIGCGTGLMARGFEGMFGRIDGVDLSPNMIDAARKTGLYRSLTAADLLAFLRESPRSYDLICAADVFIYIGDLASVFQAAKRALRTEKGAPALFAFTVQTQAQTDYLLGEDMRFAHSEAYVRRVTGEAGLKVCVFEPGAIRNDRGVPSPGHVAVLTSD
ncbi:methyltransferase domain-containing protein [Methylovirgula sp. 4M-Z18]|uniref:methyltransferase domain-containing protein n=1 Tax=Methylovirgula sp. 4M-Z18 TaxID=2293567 RepID=UPI0013143079|nr:methyltransferase domain-containing protein [Methylovirgula sp. 4M-Z18]